MRAALLSLLLPFLCSASLAQEATIAAPSSNLGNYDPQISAKEAVLANWGLAAAGIRAGQVVGRQVVALADRDVSYEELVRQALFAQKTMIQRYSSADWIHMADETVPRVSGEALRGVAAAVEATCETDGCAPERAALKAAFARATAELQASAAAAQAVVVPRRPQSDAALMTEQLTVIADYLEEAVWAEDLNLAEIGRADEEIAARIVGAIALWKNVEAYVGLTSKDVDDAINAASRTLLRQLRGSTRGDATLTPDGDAMAGLKIASRDLAAEFRQAAALFAS